MKKENNTIIGLSVLIILLPFLGIPQSWDNILFVFSGLIILGTAVSMKIHSADYPGNHKETSTFEENNSNHTSSI